MKLKKSGLLNETTVQKQLIYRALRHEACPAQGEGRREIPALREVRHRRKRCHHEAHVLVPRPVERLQGNAHRLPKLC